MQRITAILLVAIYICVFAGFPVQAGQDSLKATVNKARRSGATLEIRVSGRESLVGIIQEVSEQDFTVLNPVSHTRESVLWKSVESIRQVDRFTAENEPQFQRLARAHRQVKIETLDGSSYKGVITGTDPAGIMLQGAAPGQETRIAYAEIKKLDQEPEGQKIIRNVMIGVGVGLAVAFTTLLILMQGD